MFLYQQLLRRKNMKFSRNKKLILIALFAILVFCVGRAAVAEDVAPEATQNLGVEAEGGAATKAQAELSAGVKENPDKPGTYVPNGPGIQPPPKSGSDAPVTQPVGRTNEEITKEISAMFQVIGRILGSILALIAWFVDFAIKLGNDVIDMPIVRLGWQIVLNFTNLGFVLAIIVIAFATIFRLESYALKQTLWKLIVAALLVNFSLVIAGAFISVSNSTTNIFLQATTADNLSTALANAMQPQKFAMTIDQTESPWYIRFDPTELVKDLLKKFLAIAASLVFILIFTFLIILVFFALFLMLLIRAIALIFLLILSPLAWLFWIFPYTQQYWKKWWTEFLRWNFFAPVVLFFIYLTVATAAGLDKLISVRGASISDAAKAFQGSTMLSGGFAGHAAQLFVVLGMLFGGLYVANSFGIAGAGLAYGWAQGAGKWFAGGVGRWAGRKGVQFGTRPLRGERGSKFIAGVEAWGSKSKIPLLRTITRPVRVVGTGLNRLRRAGAEDLVADAKKRLQGYDLKKLGQMLPALNEYEQVAALEMLKAPKSLDLPEDITQFITKEMENVYVKSGQAKPDFSNVMRTVGVNYDMLPLIRQIAKLEESGQSVPAGLRAQLDEASLKFEKGHRPAHYTQFQADEFFKQMKEIDPETGEETGNILKKGEFGLSGREQLIAQRARIKSVMEANPDGFLNIFRGTKGAQRDNFVGLLYEFIDSRRGAMSRRQWLESQPKYKPLTTVLNSSAARSLGLGLEEVD